MMPKTGWHSEDLSISRVDVELIPGVMKGNREEDHGNESQS
jgi:hypothetical protein